MKLFDRIKDEESGEVRIRESENSGEKESGILRDEVEASLKDDGETGTTTGSASSGAGSSSTTGLPGMGGSTGSSSTGSTSSSTSSTTSSYGSSSSVDLEDVHEQNEKIIGLLKDIKSELGGTTGGSTSELL